MANTGVLRPVSLKEANQQFSRLIREVEGGEGFVITRRGRPVARIIPHEEDRMQDPVWVAAYERMKIRLLEGASLGGLGIEDRDALHDRDEASPPGR